MMKHIRPVDPKLGPGTDLIYFCENLRLDFPKSILDLGCGDPKSFYLLHGRKKNIKKYLGIDEKKEDEIYDYQSAYKIFKVCNPRSKMTEIDFNNLFKISYEQNLYTFLKNCDEKFDLVVLSNVLHFTDIKDRWKEVLLLAKERLNKDGLIYVKVFESNSPHYQNDASRNLFTPSELQELEEMGKVLIKQWREYKWTYLIE